MSVEKCLGRSSNDGPSPRATRFLHSFDKNSCGAAIVQDKLLLLPLFTRATSTEKGEAVFCFMILLIGCAVHNVCFRTLEISFIVLYQLYLCVCCVRLGGACWIPVNAEFRRQRKC